MRSPNFLPCPHTFAPRGAALSTHMRALQLRCRNERWGALKGLNVNSAPCQPMETKMSHDPQSPSDAADHDPREPVICEQCCRLLTFREEEDNSHLAQFAGHEATLCYSCRNDLEGQFGVGA